MVVGDLSILLDLVLQAAANSTATTNTASASSMDLQPAVVAALVSGLITTLGLYLDRYVIEPRKWYSRYWIEELGKQQRILDWLVSVLGACRQKAERLENPAGPHVLESSDIVKLETIFEKNAYLLSSDLLQTWSDLQKTDTAFVLDQVRHREVLPSGMRMRMVPLDLSKMQAIALAQSTIIRTLRMRLAQLGGLRIFRETERLDIVKDIYREAGVEFGEAEKSWFLRQMGEMRETRRKA
jgi:hypothetical protein